MLNMVDLHDAIRNLNASVVTIRDDIAYDKDEQIVQYDLQAAQAKLVELQTQETAQKQAEIDAKASALAKLAALGLTQDEVKALVG
jgi:DeoR/GlpR family transcriptional regulator of sugar metabolism